METSRRTKRSKPGLKTGAREHVLELFVSEWAIEVLQALDRSPKLYAEMRREFRAASHAALTQTLLNLQNAGLVWRKAYPTSTARVEFSLTALGKSFIAPLATLCDWADQHQPELSAAAIPREKQSKRTARNKSESSRLAR
jgi:DNA-binding HxlR family transcriptional regulator